MLKTATFYKLYFLTLLKGPFKMISQRHATQLDSRPRNIHNLTTNTEVFKNLYTQYKNSTRPVRGKKSLAARALPAFLLALHSQKILPIDSRRVDWQPETCHLGFHREEHRETNLHSTSFLQSQSPSCEDTLVFERGKKKEALSRKATHKPDSRHMGPLKALSEKCHHMKHRPV